MNDMDKIKVLVVDDSAMIRKLVTDILESDEGFKVVGTAPNPNIAREKIKQLNPDVLTLDVEMPEMDGITFLRNLMRLRPMPVVMLSTLTSKGAESTLEALNLGAVDFVCKPQMGVARSLDECAEELIAKVRIAASAKVKKAYSNNGSTHAKLNAIPKKPQFVQPRSKQSYQIEKKCLIALGASTGGTEAIRQVLERLPENTPAIVIAQHIPKEFSKSFAERMDQVSPMIVHEAEDGQVIETGHVYIAPGSHHLEVRSHSSGGYYCCLTLDPPVNRHRPSVDVLFDSVIRKVKIKTIGVLLTGMGKDGAQGLLRLKQAKAVTIAQDELTSVIWGMPGEAVKLGGADYVVPLLDVADKITSLVGSSVSRKINHH